MYQSHSTEKWSQQKQREFDQRRNQNTTPNIPKRRRGLHPLILLTPPGFVLLCGLLFVLSNVFAPSETVKSTVDIYEPPTTQKTPQNASQERINATVELVATNTPTQTPQPTIDYQSTVDALKAEQAHLEATQEKINEQIQQNQDLELQVTAQFLSGLVDIEKQRVANDIVQMEAESAASANEKVAKSLIEIANANATATITAQETKNEIEQINQANKHQQEINDTLTDALLSIIWVAAIIVILILILGFGWFWNTGRQKHALKLRNIGRQETANMMQKPARKPAQPSGNKTQNDLARLLSNSVAFWNSQQQDGRAQTQIPSYDKVGFSGEDWTRLTDYLVNLHLVEKTQGRGGGTFFKYGTLHDWLMVCLNGNIESVDPLKTAGSSPSDDA